MKTLLFLVMILFVSLAFSQQKAITDTGDEVLLSEDGRWTYVNRPPAPSTKILVNNGTFNKPQESKFLLKSKKNNSAFWINTDKWTFNKPDDNQDAEYQFHLKGEDLYGMAITEGIEIKLEALAEIALSNAQVAASDAKVVKKEYRIVNGKKIIYMEMRGTIQSIKFTYLGYYYSDASGSSQLLIYTSSNLVEKYQAEIASLLNGMVTQ